MYETSEDLRSLFSVLRRADNGANIRLPRFVLDTIQPVVDVLRLLPQGGENWLRYESLQRVTASTAVSSNIQTSVVPPDTFRFVVNAEARHTDVAPVNRVITLSHDFTTGGDDLQAIASGDFTSAFTVARVPLLRRILMPPGSRLDARAEPASGTDNIRIRYAFVDLVLAEAPIPPV